MRDQNDGPLETDERLLEDLRGRDVEVIGRLIQEEQVAWFEQKLGEGETRPFATRKA